MFLLKQEDTASSNQARVNGTEHGSRIITALEAAWAAIRQRHPEIPAAVIITGSGAHQKGIAEGYRLRGHHWPERWVTGGPGDRRAPELFIAGELLDAGGPAVLEVMLHEAAHALATVRGIKDTSAGNRYHNRRFAVLAAEMGLRPPGRPHKILGMSGCSITDQTATVYVDVIMAIADARLPYLTDAPGTGAQKGGEENSARPGKRDGRRLAVRCACIPPRRIQLTPKALDDGPVICGVCYAAFEVPRQQPRSGTSVLPPGRTSPAGTLTSPVRPAASSPDNPSSCNVNKRAAGPTPFLAWPP